MAVNGVEITVGSKWLTHCGDLVTITAELNEKPTRWMVTNLDSGKWHLVDDAGESDVRFNESDLAAPVMDASTTQKVSNPKDLVGVRKAPMSTVSAAVLAEVGVGMLEGACKYGRHNYREVGVRSSVYYDGTMRHLMSWWEGEDIDPDSQMSHITKAITSLVVLRDAMIQGKLTDDRAPRSAEFYTALNERAAAIIDKYADRNPVHYTIETCVVTK